MFDVFDIARNRTSPHKTQINISAGNACNETRTKTQQETCKHTALDALHSFHEALEIYSFFPFTYAASSRNQNNRNVGRKNLLPDAQVIAAENKADLVVSKTAFPQEPI
jgi:hypothetical protein